MWCSSTRSQSNPLCMASGVSSSPLAMSSSNPGMLNSASSSTNTADGIQAAASGAASATLPSVAGVLPASPGAAGGIVDDDENCCDLVSEAPNISAASTAARRTSSAAEDVARGRTQAESGKLRWADSPRRAMAATSCALAATSGVRNVPSQMRLFLRGSRTSHTHLSPLRSRTPWYTGWRVSRNFFLPAFRLGEGAVAREAGAEHAVERPEGKR
ncbi:unnamed protein product [Musa hybrid cultivar]